MLEDGSEEIDALSDGDNFSDMGEDTIPEDYSDLPDSQEFESMLDEGAKDLAGEDYTFDNEDAQGIMTWCEDIDYEASRTGESPEEIRFTENAIKERYLQLHESGVYVLLAPVRKTDSFRIDSHHVEAIIENLKLCDFDIILIDTGPNILDYTLMALSKVDEIYTVCNCDMLSAKRVDGMIGDIYTQMEGFNFGKIGLLVNKMHEKSSVSPGELAKALNLPLVGEVPYYPEIVEINNEGVSVFFNRRKPSGQATEYAAAFKALARKLIRPDSGKGSGNSNFTL